MSLTEDFVAFAWEVFEWIRVAFVLVWNWPIDEMQADVAFFPSDSRWIIEISQLLPIFSSVYFAFSVYKLIQQYQSLN